MADKAYAESLMWIPSAAWVAAAVAIVLASPAILTLGMIRKYWKEVSKDGQGKETGKVR